MESGSLAALDRDDADGLGAAQSAARARDVGAMAHGPRATEAPLFPTLSAPLEVVKVSSNAC